MFIERKYDSAQEKKNVSPLSNVGGNTILLVEDDASNVEMLQLLIGMETTYSVISFERAEEVIQRIEEVKAIKPILFLLDYHLPLKNALELYDYLHATEGLEQVSAIIISASLKKEIIEEIEKRNICFLYKPFDVDYFLHLLERVLA